MISQPKIRRLVTCFLLSALGASVALADDTEIFVSQAASTGAQPNVLFVIDTSGSMGTDVEVTPELYDSGKTYGGCDPSRIYYSTNGSTPKCSSNNWFPAASNRCDASQKSLSIAGFWGPGRAAQFRTAKKKTSWTTLAAGDSSDVECLADDGVHGQITGSTSLCIANNGSGWSNSCPSGLWSGLNTTYTFFTPNYVDYYYSAGAGAAPATRMSIVKQVSTSLANSLNNVNIGLMRYSSDAQGGMVLEPVADIATNRSAIVSAINGLNPNGNTPLTETLYEASLYYSGLAVDYGNRSSPVLSAPSSRTPANSNIYKSPIQYQCQKSFIVYLTDGLPTADENANSKVPNLPGFSAALGRATCDAPDAPPSGSQPVGNGRCGNDLTAYLNKADLSSMPGTQNVQTYMIGFGSDPLLATTGTPYLDALANAGGTTSSHTAADALSLTTELQKIFTGIQNASTTFVTPSVTVNAFNRTQLQNDLFFTLFKVGEGAHWPGNLKKYQLKVSNGTAKIVDAFGADAIDPNGLFALGTTSIWSPSPDGSDITAGGAVSQLKAPSARTMFTFLGNNNLADPTNINHFDVSNTAITDAMLNTGGTNPTRDTVINWARGFDVDDSNNDGLKTDQVQFMGDPLHARPGLVVYGGTTSSPDPEDTVVYMPTNDGFLHAIRGRTTGSGGGTELWAFVPPELLGRLVDLYQDAPGNPKTYGLDGDVQVLKFDGNRDGIVDAAAGDFVWIFFGMRGGGDHYYALNVTDPTTPLMMWKIGPSELPGVGQTWSPPVVARVKVGAGGSTNTNAQKFVLIFGGGYDTAQEGYTYTTDTVGNRIFMVDAQTGGVLWYAGGSGGPGSPNLVLAKMNNSIPARISVIDIDGDQLADRMYASDTGGRIWRFDIFNNNPANTLVAGGVLAQLGAGSNASPTLQNTRRFYYAPDVALIQRRAVDPYFNIAIGSGYRGHPLETATQDRLYAVRDKQPFARLTQATYNTLTPILDTDLVDITANPGVVSVPLAAAGWQLQLRLNGGWVGEKSLAESTTVENVIFFTTYEPGAPNGNSPCVPSATNRVYALKVDNGGAALDFNDDGIVDNNTNATGSDLFSDLHQDQGIAGGTTVGMYSNGANNGTTPICTNGWHLLSKCVGPGGAVRTFWNRNDVQ